MDQREQGVIFAERVYAALAEVADSVRSEAMERYMRNRFVFFGIPAPARKQRVKPFLAEWSTLPIGAAWTAVEWWWGQDERECQYVAMELIQRRHRSFLPADLDLIEALLVRKSWWDTVDFIAANLAGSYFLLFPEQIREVTLRWNRSGNFWLRRTSIIFQLKYRQKTREDLLFDYCASCAGEREFFIRKAIGWALRQYAKTNPDRVRQYLFTQQLSPLSVKEARKSLG